MGKPLGKIIEVEPFAKQMETGGYITSVTNEYMPEKGKVLSVGGLVEGIKVGDDILFHKGSYSKVTINNKEVLLMEEKNVFYIL